MGPCINSRQRYYFNKRAGKCEQFTYGGCKGNANNFLTYDTCYSKCVKRMYGGGDRKNNTNQPNHQNKDKNNGKDTDDNTNVCKQQIEKGNVINWDKNYFQLRILFALIYILQFQTPN